jgi:hypothetical protein
LGDQHGNRGYFLINFDLVWDRPQYIVDSVDKIVDMWISLWKSHFFVGNIKIFLFIVV